MEYTIVGWVLDVGFLYFLGSQVEGAFSSSLDFLAFLGFVSFWLLLLACGVFGIPVLGSGLIMAQWSYWAALAPRQNVDLKVVQVTRGFIPILLIGMRLLNGWPIQCTLAYLLTQIYLVLFPFTSSTFAQH